MGPSENCPFIYKLYGTDSFPLQYTLARESLHEMKVKINLCGVLTAIIEVSLSFSTSCDNFLSSLVSFSSPTSCDRFHVNVSFSFSSILSLSSSTSCDIFFEFFLVFSWSSLLLLFSLFFPPCNCFSILL
jgi:hypothetical protein